MDRSKIKATPIATLQKQTERVASLTEFQSGRAEYLKIKPGENTFRIFPAHPGTTSFIYEKVLHWLPRVTKKKDDDGNVEEKIERRPIFNSRIHGDLPKDLVEEYIRIAVKKHSAIIQDKEELQKKLSPILDWRTGIKPTVSWVCYAKRVEGDTVQFGLLDISNGTKEKLNELSIAEDTADPITTDPFTGLDDGKAIKITYNKKAANKKDVYRVSLLWRQNWPISDEELDEWGEHETLEKLFRNSYKRKDFLRAIEGLEILDEKHELGVLEEDEFQSVLAELDSLVPEEEEEQDEEVNDDQGKPENDGPTTTKPAPPVTKRATKPATTKPPVASTEDKPKGKRVSLDEIKAKYGKK